jgi:hypothetical protein
MVGAQAENATCCHETGSAEGRRAWGRVAGETAGRRMRGLRACVRVRVNWCGDGVGRRGRVAAASPRPFVRPLGRM